MGRAGWLTAAQAETKAPARARDRHIGRIPHRRKGWAEWLHAPSGRLQRVGQRRCHAEGDEGLGPIEAKLFAWIVHLVCPLVGEMLVPVVIGA